MKKVGSLLLAVVLISTVFGLGVAQADTAAFQPTTLNLLLLGDPPKDLANVQAAIEAKLAADGLPFTLNFQFLPDYWNKLAMTVAGGEAADVAWAHVNTLSDLVSKRVYQPIDEAYAQYAPDIKANMPDYVLKAGTVGGKLYALPRVIPMAEYRNVYNIRGDLREKYGLEPIKTLEDFNKYLEAVHTNNPEMYCFAGDYNMEQLFPVFANYYFPVGDGGRYPVYVDPTDPTHTVKTFFDSEAMASMCATSKDWAAKGYIPTDDSKVADAGQGFNYGTVAAIPASIFSQSERIDSFAANVPGGKIETVLLNPEPKYIFQSGDNMLAVPSTSKHVNEAVALINWIKKDQANYDLWSYGVEGVNYKLDGDSVSVEGIAPEKGYSTMVWMWNDLRLARFSKHITQDYLDMLRDWDTNAIKTPYIGFTLDQSAIKVQVANCNAVLQEYWPNLCKATMDYATVKEELVKKLNDSGIQDIVNACQEQLNAYIAAQTAQ